METAKDERALEVDKYFSSYPLPPARNGHLCVNLAPGRGKNLYLAFYDRPNTANVGSTDATGAAHGRCLLLMESRDRGRTWGEPWPLRDRAGKPILGWHQGVIRLPSGRLGLIHSGFGVAGSHPGRDFGTSVVFRTSDDEGRVWSDPIPLGPTWSICLPGHAIVLPEGRIIVPVWKWVSPNPTNDAEESTAAGLSYSFNYVSDDEGLTWKRGLSELFVSVRRAAYDLEEPAVVELTDGRILMHLRSQLGRIYRCFSADRGITWSRPEPLDIAAAYTPTFLCRIPQSGHLLMIWNQSSRQEILTGSHRIRLSCAVSKDEGQTWGNFRNVEALDDTTVVPPPPRDQVEVLQQWEDDGYYQPVNVKRYHRAPGVVRVCYPNVVFVDDEAIVTYDYGLGTLGEGVHGVKLRAIPVTWFNS
jgi:hypothetical protein